MFSKKSFLCLFVSFLILGCAQEHNEYSDIIDIRFGKEKSSGSLNCVGEPASYIKPFIAGQLSAEKLKEFWTCTATVLSLFELYGKGIDSEKFSKVEISRFVSRYLTPMNSQVAQEILKIKNLLVGGNSHFFTKSEIQKLKKVLVVDLQTITNELRPHMGVLSSGILLEKMSQPKPEQFNDATEALQNSVAKLGQLIQSNNQEYHFGDFGRLLYILSKGQDFQINKKKIVLTDLVTTLQHTKALLVGPDLAKIKVNEWPRFFAATADAYSIWLRWENFISEQDASQGSSQQQLNVIIELMHKLVSRGLDQQADKTYNEQQAFGLLTSLDKTLGMPLGLSLQEVKALWVVLTDKILAAGAKFEKVEQGLNRVKLDYLLAEFSAWSKVQDYINRSTAKGNFNAKEESIKNHLGRVVRTAPWPLNYDKYGRINVGDKSKTYERNSLINLNISFSVIKLLVHAYAEDEKRSRKAKSVTPQELETMFVDLKAALVAIGLIGPDADKSFVNKIFRDSNLFMPHSNGNKYVELEEGVDFYHYIISVRNSRNLYIEEMDQLCLHSTTGGIKEYEASCYIQYITDNRKVVFGNLPKLVKYADKLLKKNNKKWFRYIENIAATVGVDLSQLTVSASTIFEMQMLFHYVETIMASYDHNDSSTIDEVEAIHFVKANIEAIGLILRQDPLLFEDLIISQVTYMLNYGLSPLDPDDPMAGLRSKYWQENPDKWDFEADRLRLSEVLVELVGD